MAIQEPDRDTFPKLLLRHAQERSAQPAIREKARGIWHTMTWRALADEAAALAAALSARGLRRGAHAALVGDNRPRLYTAMAAVQWLGAVATPLYPDASPADIAAALKRAEVTHVFAENQEQVDKLLAVLGQCPSVRCIVYDKDRGMRHYRQPQLVPYEALLEEGRKIVASGRAALDAEAAKGTGQDTAFLFFTSGTTGPAKGVVLTYEALIDRAKAVIAMEGLTHRDVAMAYLPPGWIGQNFFGYIQPMVAGYCVCCPESSETMLADMREIAPTYFLSTPRVLEMLLTQVSMRMEDSGGLNLRLYRYFLGLAQRIGARQVAGQGVGIGAYLASWIGNLLIYGPLRDVLGMGRVRVAYSAGDAVAPDLLMFFRALGINLKQLYGSTETGFFVSMQRDKAVKPGTVGQPISGVELKISAEREILVRTPGLFKEYHGDPKATAQARAEEGWFRTGDAGQLDADGHLRIIDRMAYVGALKDGTLYAPRLLENRLKLLPSVKEAVVFGDGREMVCALLDVDIEVVGRWAEQHAMTYTGHADLASREEVYALIADAIASINADPALAGSSIRRFAILPKELTAEDGMLTPTGKLRRNVIAERYRALVDAMYQGQSDASVAITGSDVERIKVRDAKASAQTKRSA